LKILPEYVVAKAMKCADIGPVQHRQMLGGGMTGRPGMTIRKRFGNAGLHLRRRRFGEGDDQ